MEICTSRRKISLQEKCSSVQQNRRYIIRCTDFDTAFLSYESENEFLRFQICYVAVFEKLSEHFPSGYQKR